MSSGLRSKFKVSFMLGFDFPQKNLFNLQKNFLNGFDFAMGICLNLTVY